MKKIIKYIGNIFTKKVDLEKCSQCEKLINDCELYALRKYYGDEREFNIENEKLFCSLECLNGHTSQHDATDYEKEKILRCAAFYECLGIDNLRGICERCEDIDPKLENNFILPSNFCKPGDAGLIKSAVLLQKQAQESSRNINIQFYITLILTGFIIYLTILNILITKNNSNTSSLEKINENIILMDKKNVETKKLIDEKMELLIKAVKDKEINIIKENFK